MMKRVRVTRWCKTKAESRTCLRLVLTDAAKIDKALASSTWRTPTLAAPIARRFRKCIEDCGGAAELIDA